MEMTADQLVRKARDYISENILDDPDIARALVVDLTDALEQTLTEYDALQTSGQTFFGLVDEKIARVWDEGAKWVLEELGHLTETQPLESWLAPDENPYRDGSK